MVTCGEQDCVVPTLDGWLQQERAGVYKATHATFFWCKACGHEVNFFRKGMSGLQNVKAHERRNQHRLGLQREGLETEGLLRNCQGIRIGTGVAPELDDIEDALRVWQNAGFLQTSHEDPSATSRQFFFCFQGDSLILKSEKCLRLFRQGEACMACLDTAAHRDLRLQAIKWTSRIHLANYGHALAHGTRQERAQMRAELRLRDVYKTRPGCLEIEPILKEKQEAYQLQLIKHRWQSIRMDWRTSRLQAYIDANIATLPLQAAREEQRDILRLGPPCPSHIRGVV